MTKKTRDTSRLTKALLETADDMRRSGIMDAAAHEKITLRHLGGEPEPGAEPITGEEIRLLRESAHRVRPPYEPDGGLRLAAGAGCETCNRSRTCAPQRHSPQGHRGDSLRRLAG
jgi:hypothetical protein